MSPESPVREGDVIAEKYRVERVLGVGGMGVVVAAMHLELDERVALKFLLPEGAANADVAARFAQEARAAVKIKSEHVARVVDVGKLPGGAPFMVMEFMDGEDLERVLAANGPLPIELAVGYLLQASEAIAEAHALGIVHRDLKPANLFLARRPSGPPIVKVLDFGISKALGSTSRAQLTKTSHMLGSPFYMSPEQMNASKNVDARTDQWALGVVLYELLSGHVPFEGDSIPALVGAVLSIPPRPLRPFRPDLPEALEAVILRCLEKRPVARFPDVGALARQLAPFGPPSSALSVERIDHLLGSKVAVEPAVSQAPALDIASAGPLRLTPSTGDALSHDSGGRASAEPGPSPSRRAPFVGGAVALLTMIVLALAYSRPGTSTIASPAASSGVAPTNGEATPTASSLPAVAAPPSTGSASSDVPLSAEPAPQRAGAGTSPAPSAPATPHGRTTPHAKPPATAAAVDCDPPYLIDPASGHRTYKPECIH